MPGLMLNFPETSVVGESVIEKLLRKMGLKPEVINEHMKHLYILFTFYTIKQRPNAK